MEFDRFQICLGYWLYATYGYTDYAEACHIATRLKKMGYKPGLLEESFDTLLEQPIASATYGRLTEAGYYPPGDDNE